MHFQISSEHTHKDLSPVVINYRDINLQTLKNVCVLVAVVLKRVHNLLKEILKNRRNACFFSKEKKEKALSPSNPACRLNKIVWNHCFDSHWLKARVALLVKLLNLLWFKHFFFLMHPCFSWPWNALSHPFLFFQKKISIVSDHLKLS